MEPLKLTFNGRPPSVNFCYRTARGKIYKQSPAKKFTEEIHSQLTEQLNKIEGFTPYKDAIKFDVVFYLRHNRYIDTDNMLKVVFDSFNKTKLYDDDKIISHIVARRVMGCDNDKFDIVISLDDTHDNNNKK